MSVTKLTGVYTYVDEYGNKQELYPEIIPDSSLSTKGKAADAKAVGDALANKADTSTVNAALANKADTSTVNAALANKADIGGTPQFKAVRIDNVNGPCIYSQDTGDLNISFTDYRDDGSGLRKILSAKAVYKSMTSSSIHASDKNNPHGVTMAQLGMEKVENTADADKSVKHAATANYSTSAGSAEKARCDSDGNVISESYSKTDHGHSDYLSINGGTLKGHLKLYRSASGADYGSMDLCKSEVVALSIFGGYDKDPYDVGGSIRANLGNLYLCVPNDNDETGKKYYIVLNNDLKIPKNIIGGDYLNVQVGEAFQVRDTNDEVWKPINALSFNDKSSKRYKKNIVDMSDEEAKNILKYRVVNYDYINEKNGTNCQGLIAEEVAEICEYPVYRTPDGKPDGLDYSRFVPQLIKMVQLQQNKIDGMSQEIAELKTKICS